MHFAQIGSEQSMQLKRLSEWSCFTKFIRVLKDRCSWHSLMNQVALLFETYRSNLLPLELFYPLIRKSSAR